MHASRCTSRKHSAEITLHCKSQKDNTEKFGVLLKTFIFFRYDVWGHQAASFPRVIARRGIPVDFLLLKPKRLITFSSPVG
jgi:hypothetical protein